MREPLRVTSYLLILALALVSAPAGAATHTVCAVGCDASSVQGGINLASAGDVVELLTTNPLTEDDIIVNESVEIRGLGQSLTVLQAAPLSGTATNRVFWILPGRTVTIRDLTVQNGVTGGEGGCILNEGDLTLQDVTVTGCSAAWRGGAIASSGALRIVESRVASSESAMGGGIATTGTLSGDGCVIEYNAAVGVPSDPRGGALLNEGPSRLFGCRIASNGDPAGAAVLTRADLELVETTVSHTDGGGILHEGGALTLQRSEVSDNAGYGIRSLGPDADDLVLRSSAMVANGDSALAVCGVPPARLTNVTIVNNESDASGGGIFVCAGDTVRIASSTIAGNVADRDGDGFGDGGGIYLEPPSSCPGFCQLARAELRNTILGVNRDYSPSSFRRAHDCDGNLTSEGHNLLQDAGTNDLLELCVVSGDLTGVQTGVDPMGASIYDHGGPTRTLSLWSDSPAIDAGDPAGCVDSDGNPLPRDQRGALRVGLCDVGAFEYGGEPPIFLDGFESSDAVAWSSAAP